MPVMVVAHPIPGFNGRVVVDDVALNFIGGFALGNVPVGAQAVLTSRGFTLNATPGSNYGGKYVLEEDLTDPGSQASAALRAAFDAVYAPIGSGGSGGGLTVAATVTAAGALVAGKHNPVDTTSGALTMTLPTGTSGKLLAVEKTDGSANAITVSGSLRGSASTISLVWAHETLLLASDTTGSWWPVAGHKTKASLDAAFAPINPAALVDNLPSPFYMAHRMGSGQAAEESLTAARIAVAQGAQVLDFDMRLLADGTLVAMHDATVNRTTTGTGNVADFALPSWLKLTMNHAGLVGGTGWPVEAPLTVEQILREFGNKVILSPEPYVDGAYAAFDKLITAMGIDRRTILLQPSLTADYAPAIAAGYRCLQVTSAEPTTQSCADLKAAGWWGVAPAIAVTTSAAVTAAHAAGLKIVPYSMIGRFDRDKMLALGVDGVFTDYPGYTSGTNATRTTDNFTAQARTLGTIPIDGSGSMSFTAPNILHLADLRVLLGYLAPPDPSNFVLNFDARFTADGGATSSAFYVFAMQSDFFTGDGRTTQNGVTLDASDGYRFSGLANPGAQASLFGIILNNNVQANILTNGPGNYTINTWASYRLTVTPTQLKWEQVGVTGSVFLNRAEYRPLRYIGIGCSAAAAVDFRNVVLT